MHREVLDAVIAKQPDRAEKATLKLIDGARDDIQHVLSTRKRLPKITRPAAQLKAA
jgi:DNA-binding GntR family transcriptional regulator